MYRWIQYEPPREGVRKPVMSRVRGCNSDRECGWDRDQAGRDSGAQEQGLGRWESNGGRELAVGAVLKPITNALLYSLAEGGLDSKPRGTFIPADFQVRENLVRECPNRAIPYDGQSARGYIFRRKAPPWWSKWWSIRARVGRAYVTPQREVRFPNSWIYAGLLFRIAK